VNAAELLNIIQKGNSLDKEDFRALIKLHETFPYFLVPKVLAAKYEQKVSEGESKELLHWAAVQSPDRAWLKSLITEDIPFLHEAQKKDNPDPKPKSARSITIIKEEEAEKKDIKEEPTKSTSSNSNRAEILKKLEENLSKLKKQEPETTSPKEEKLAEKTPDKPKPSPAKKSSPKRKRSGDDLIETIKKKEKKVIRDAKKQEQIDIIKAFSKKEIKLATIKENEDSNKIQDLSVSSTQLNDKLLSESYAKLLTKQGKKDKAIEIYQKLILKFPKKKAYFADLIEELKA